MKKSLTLTEVNYLYFAAKDAKDADEAFQAALVMFYPLRAPYPFSAEAYVNGAKKDLGHFKSLKLAQEAIEKACEGES